MLLTLSYLFLSLQFLPTQCRCRVYSCTWSHSDTPHSVGFLCTRDRPVAETSTWQHTTLTTDIHAPGGIRIRNPCKEAAADPCLRPCCYWDRLVFSLPCTNILKHVPRQLNLCSPLRKCDQVPFFFFFAVALRPNAGHGLLILEVSRSHITTHHSR